MTARAPILNLCACRLRFHTSSNDSNAVSVKVSNQFPKRSKLNPVNEPPAARIKVASRRLDRSQCSQLLPSPLRAHGVQTACKQIRIDQGETTVLSMRPDQRSVVDPTARQHDRAEPRKDTDQNYQYDASTAPTDGPQKDIEESTTERDRPNDQTQRRCTVEPKWRPPRTQLPRTARLKATLYCANSDLV